MKINFLIIILSFIYSIEDDSYYEYDLISGSSTQVSALLQQTTYKFYIPAVVDQKADIQITITDPSYTSNQYITVYEYSNRTLQTELKKTRIVLSYNFTQNIYFETYNVSESSCTYISFEIIPEYKMTSAFITATVARGIYEYDLFSSGTVYFYTMSTLYIYKLFLEVNYGETVNVEIDRHDSITSSIEITFYQYATRNATIELFKKNFILSYDSTRSKYSQSFKNVDKNCNYFAFEITPYYQMSYVHFRAIIGVEYDLDINSPKNFDALSNFYIYKFYVSANNNQNVTIEFSTSDSFTRLSQTITIYEHSTRA